ncbi:MULTISPECIES: mycofactocin biosynthesis peptidyl-dipeptidase MftE [Nocardia]|uniref:mycofactocin biosynthesis peptidyl-dipeptidase MftE n=1 Tax=Nocardia TaxID=1817 RepID=UPI0009EE2982|nr:MULTISPECIES: mycofactocin biosynthesis peptidyl-dipeptidase MftE [Nocardia]MBF6278407.1 mycofactocin biosynthesis peptidyl-dipeptidase MftE [Nocardia nova]
MKLAEQRSPELAGRAGKLLLAVPLGATEQHGPHLPVGTDTAIATELCRRLAAWLPDIVVAPALPYGSSGEHAGFSGTLSIGRAALELLVVELVRSADAFAGVVLVNGHGGNVPSLRAAVATLAEEGRAVMLWSPSGRADDSHAGHSETSVMLFLRPDDVAKDQARPGNARPLPELFDTIRRHGIRAVSPTGVLGDPPAPARQTVRRSLIGGPRSWSPQHTSGSSRVRRPPDREQALGFHTADH